MHNASSAIAQKQTKQIHVIHGYLKKECCPACEKLWYKSGIEVLGSNRIHPIVYATALHELIIHGIGKFHNILTIDPTNCGKNIFIKAP